MNRTTRKSHAFGPKGVGPKPLRRGQKRRETLIWAQGRCPSALVPRLRAGNNKFSLKLPTQGHCWSTFALSEEIAHLGFVPLGQSYKTQTFGLGF